MGSLVHHTNRQARTGSLLQSDWRALEADSDLWQLCC